VLADNLSMNSCYLTLFLVTCFVSTSVNAELFKWTDKNGEFHISDRPPLDPNEVKMKNRKHAKKRTVTKQKKIDKTVVAWRCKELEDQYATAKNKAERFSMNKNLAAAMQSDAENYRLALEKICQ